MGTFANYTGSMQIPEDKREEFSQHMTKLLNYGGMMNVKSVNIYGHELSLLKPIEIKPEGKVSFYFNYFEDDSWEIAGFDAGACSFWSNKIGSQEFHDVIVAAYTLCELYDDDFGVAEVDGNILQPGFIVGWLNHLLGTSFTLEKRRNLWKTVESYIYSKDERYREYFGYKDLMDLIPRSRLKYAGSVELTDLCYIVNGTKTLIEDQVAKDSYPADVLICKNRIENYLTDHDSQKKEKIYELVKMKREQREKIQEAGLKGIAECSLGLPARMLVYLTAEICEEEFWKIWEKVRQDAYSDEELKAYADTEVEKVRTDAWKTPVAGINTSKYLCQDNVFTFYDTPEELDYKPKYFVSDADRLYWWDGSDEVIISDDVDQWIKKLAERHSQLMDDDMDTADDGSSDHFIRDFIETLADVDQTYKKIAPFHNMFYEFLENGIKKQYRAAVLLLKELTEDNKAEGKAIQYLKGSWNLSSRKITFNPGRLRIKRYMSIMANTKLREKYFGF